MVAFREHEIIQADQNYPGPPECVSEASFGALTTLPELSHHSVRLDHPDVWCENNTLQPVTAQCEIMRWENITGDWQGGSADTGGSLLITLA